MTSRRIFLKNGGLALVSLGFAPEFLARTAAAARCAPQGADHDLPARRGRRPEHGRAVRRARRTTRRGRASRSASLARGQAPRSISTASSACIRGWRRSSRSIDARHARDRPRLRLARRHALALRRAGLHGDGNAGREEHAGRLAQSLPARARAPGGDAVPRGRAGAAAAAALQGPRRRSRSARSTSSASAPARAPRWCSRRSRASTRRPPIACSTPTGREAFDAVKMLKDADPARYAPANGAEYPRVAVRRGAAADRAARSRPTSGSRSRSPNRATGITTPTKAPRPGSSPTASTTSAAASPRSSAISATACRTSSS